jgi:hypothetical protein
MAADWLLAWVGVSMADSLFRIPDSFAIPLPESIVRLWSGDPHPVRPFCVSFAVDVFNETFPVKFARIAFPAGPLSCTAIDVPAIASRIIMTNNNLIIQSLLALEFDVQG